MTTATIPQETTTAPVTQETQPIELASMFYGPPPVTTIPTSAPAPATTTESGSTATPVQASAVSAEAAVSLLPIGTEAKTESDKPQEKPAEKPESDAGHKAAARRLGQELADLKREFTALTESHRVLQAKADGTYEEPAKPTTEEVEARAEFRGRETASRAIAEQLFGETEVMRQIYEDDSAYKLLVQAQPWLHLRVTRHPQPAVEAMRVLKEQVFLEKYGADVTQWVAKIEAELTPRLMTKFQTQTIMPMTGVTAPTVTGARGSGGMKTEKSLGDLFYGKS